MSVTKSKTLGRRLRKLCGLSSQDVFPFEAFTFDPQKLIAPQVELEFFSTSETGRHFLSAGSCLAASFGKNKSSTASPSIQALYFNRFESCEQRRWATFSVAHEMGHALLEHPGINKFTAAQRDILIAAPGTESGVRGTAMQSTIGLSDHQRRRAWAREIDANTFAVYFLSDPGELSAFGGVIEWSNWFDLPHAVAVAFEPHFKDQKA